MNDQEILGLEDQRFAAMVARDFSALDKMVHEELLYTHSSGVTDTKASWLDSMKSGKVKYKSVRGRAAIEAEIGGQRTPQGWKFAAWQSCPQP
jgi:hypothetical protein